MIRPREVSLPTEAASRGATAFSCLNRAIVHHNSVIPGPRSGTRNPAHRNPYRASGPELLHSGPAPRFARMAAV